MKSLNATEHPASSIQPIPPPTLVDISTVESIYNKYYQDIDEVNSSAFNQGKLIKKDITTDHTRILKSIVFLILDDIKTTPVDNISESQAEENSRYYDKITAAILSLLDLLDSKNPNVKHNKRVVAKLFGYLFSLHNIHNI
tara:strand:+ start:117 stop:539 length:423 start_codon:yes stop_codon:yes gene_type:complete